MGDVPVMVDHASSDMKFEPYVNKSSTANPGSPMRRNRGEKQHKPVLEWVESGLTVNIGKDLKLVTGKDAPKIVNRAGASPNRASPNRANHKAPPQNAGASVRKGG